jgi:hypothetical protein
MVSLWRHNCLLAAVDLLCWQSSCYEAAAIWQPSAPADNECEGSTIMKNPLDSLGQTILLGFVLTVIVAVLIPIFGA